MFSLKIAGGTVYNGMGGPPFAADVGIAGERIEAVGDLSATAADAVIDARGMAVCPGFIDVHSHSDTYLFIEPDARSKVFQGITTEIVGNCGASAAPLLGSYRMPADWLDKEYPGAWKTVAEYRALVDAVKPAVNVAMLLGHNTVRAGVAGYANRPLSKSETDRAAHVIEQGMDEGARGLSTGLIYPPGMFAPVQELKDLARVVGRRRGIYTSHMRSEGAQLLEAIEETIAVGRRGDVNVEISHLKTSGKGNWHLIDRALELIRTARAAGVNICADRYPYTSSATDLDVVFPPWAEEGGRDAILGRLRDPSTRARLREELLAKRAPDYWGTITVGSTAHPDNRRFQGMNLADIAAELKMEPVDAVLHLTETDELKTGAFFSGMSEENMIRILREPYVMGGTDASVRAPDGPLSRDFPHPRAYGSFPRLLRMAIDGVTMPVEEAVCRLTSKAATHYRLSNRGVLARGGFADIVVFDPASVRDRATFAAPHQLSQGIVHLLVNGVHTLKDGALTGRRAGRFV